MAVNCQEKQKQSLSLSQSHRVMYAVSTGASAADVARPNFALNNPNNDNRRFVKLVVCKIGD